LGQCEKQLAPADLELGRPSQSDRAARIDQWQRLDVVDNEKERQLFFLAFTGCHAAPEISPPPTDPFKRKAG
jgi:uncharacterized ParB-like nuclease family protein